MVSQNGKICQTTRTFESIFSYAYVTGWQFSLGTPVSSTNKTECHDITKILLKVALNSINQPFKCMRKIKYIPRGRNDRVIRRKHRYKDTNHLLTFVTVLSADHLVVQPVISLPSSIMYLQYMVEKRLNDQIYLTFDCKVVVQLSTQLCKINFIYIIHAFIFSVLVKWKRWYIDITMKLFQDLYNRLDMCSNFQVNISRNITTVTSGILEKKILRKCRSI